MSGLIIDTYHQQRFPLEAQHLPGVRPDQIEDVINFQLVIRTVSSQTDALIRRLLFWCYWSWIDGLGARNLLS